MEQKTLLNKTLAVLALAYHGLHNVPWKLSDHKHWIEIDVPASLHTYDFDKLTRLVVGAHDECVRMEIQRSGPTKVKLMFHNRKREGRRSERHPTIEEAVRTIRGEWKMPELYPDI